MERSAAKKLILSAVIGIIAGGLSGFAYSFFTGLEDVEPEMVETLAESLDVFPLQGYCLGKDEPRVLLYWSLPKDVTTNTLFRSMDDGDAILVFDARDSDPARSTYTDENVLTGHTFSYFYQTDEGIRSDILEVIVDSGSCNR